MRSIQLATLTFLAAACSTDRPDDTAPEPTAEAIELAAEGVARTAQAIPPAVESIASVEDATRTTPADDATQAPAEAAPDRPRRERPADWGNVHAQGSTRASASPSRELSTFEREARARELFASLSPDEQKEFVEWLESEVQYLTTFQNTLMRFVLESSDSDRGLWPPREELPFFEPRVHAPAQVIERKRLAPDDSLVAEASASILGAIAPRQLVSGWIYDYAKREPRRLPNEDDPRRLFENALLGLPPGWDYVEVLVERALDDGSLQTSFEAFAHAYTDRFGGVYPFTLYDAHSSRATIEMPDVDAVGLIHVILDDWETWKAVVSDDQQASLYGRIGELFTAVHRHRGLRHNLARAFLCGTTELRDGYQLNLDRFHGIWEASSSTPTTLAATLPDVDGWETYLNQWIEHLAADETAFLKGIRRRYTLDADAGQVRALTMRSLDQYVAERKDR